MQSNLFNQQNAALQPMYFWLGQIVDDETWKDNELREKWDDPQQIPGWGSRFRVRIFGRDFGDVENSRLDMAECIYPVTSGSGHGSSWQSANLKKGAYVIGFYRDGIDRDDPVILGCWGNNDQTFLSQTIPTSPFEPFSGFVNGTGVPYYAIPPGGSPPVPNEQPHEANTGSANLRNNANDQQQQQDGERSNFIRSKCDPANLHGVQKVIQNLIFDIENAKKSTKDWKNTVLKPINYGGRNISVADYIQLKTNNAAKDISKFLKDIIDEIRKYVTERVNNLTKDSYYALLPNERPQLKQQIENANNLISCLFNNIISNLISTISRALLQITNRVINTASCLVENLIGGLLGKLVGLIGTALSTILRPIEALIGGVFDLAGDILGFVGNLIGFFACEEEATCGELKEWSIWNGSGSNRTINFTNLFNNVQNFATTAVEVADPNLFNYNLDFSDIFVDDCNLGPVLCGPPTVVFFGGGGESAAANAIISATGDILGVDIISTGFNYVNPPYVRFEDSCGKGTGAVGRAVIGPVSQQSDGIYVADPNGTTYGVTGVIIEQPGNGYLPSPNGDVGGEGRVWATRGQSTIQRADGTWDTPYDPGEVMNIRVGDTVQLCEQLSYISTKNETITAPECPIKRQQVGNNSNATQPSSTISQYPVVLSLCGVEIINSGVAYKNTDKIIVSPDNGAVLEPIFGPFGSLENIKVINPGIGFTERPDIYIETKTGYNANIVPILCVNRIGDIPEDQFGVDSGEAIIHVVDCVGKV